MARADTKILDPDVAEWFERKGNKSELTRRALKLLYQQEITELKLKQNKKLEVEIIG